MYQLIPAMSLAPWTHALVRAGVAQNAVTNITPKHTNENENILSSKRSATALERVTDTIEDVRKLSRKEESKIKIKQQIKTKNRK